LIVTTSKPLEEIETYILPYQHVLVVGCGVCATLVQTGGEKEVLNMANMLRGKWFVDTTVFETPCDVRLSRKDWRKIKKKLGDSLDAILCLTCGAGVQTLTDIVDIPCFPGLNTHFLGKVERIGLYYERCRACGECIIGETMGICPVTRCAKGLMNGPCGGAIHGKCEVGGYIRDCAWSLIWERLRKHGRMDLFRKTRPPRQYGLMAFPRGIDAIHYPSKRKSVVMSPEETEEIILANHRKR
jgi:hypothetical protein